LEDLRVGDWGLLFTIDELRGTIGEDLIYARKCLSHSIRKS